MDIGGSGGIASSPGTVDDKFARRRSRRVSFADTTAVHVFDRDEDFETPPEEREPGSTSPSPSPGRSSAGREDEDDTGEDFHRPPVNFLQDVDSSSPGSAAGSMASVDDENFFGPVSASFIQTGRPSDSGMSEDDNHDITMDSRTFSLYFRNIAPPDDCTANSAASLMTPNTASEGPLKELTASNPATTSINCRDTLTDMSLLSGSRRTYDYDKLSPTLRSMMKKIKGSQQASSHKVGVSDVPLDCVLTLSTSEKESREENLCIDNGISSDNLGIVNTTVEHASGRNPVSTSTDLIQEDNEMIIDGHENSQNCNHDHMDVDPGANNAVEPPAKISPAYKSFMSNGDIQSHLVDQSLSKHQPSGSNFTTSVSSICNVDMATHLLDQPPGKDNTDATQSSSAATAILLMDAEQLRQRNEVMDTETVLHTPRTAGLQLQVPQGSLSSLRLKRQKLFATTVSNTSKVARQEGCSLGTEFVEHDKRISSLKPQELPAASRLQLVEKKEHGHQESDMFSNTEDHDSTLSVSSHSVPKLKKTSESFILGTPQRHRLNESTKVPDTSCPVITLDSQPSRECNSHLDLDGVGRKRTAEENGHAVQECPEETAKTARSPRKSRKEIPCVSQPSPMVEEKQNDAHVNGKSLDIDWNKVVRAITNATEQVLSASISKYNLQQLDMLSDKLDEIRMANKYKRLATALRIKDCYGDKQKRLEEARFLHDKLFFEKAKLQINNMKLVKLQKKAQLCQNGIQECCFLKSKILGAAQMKDASFPAAISVSASDRQLCKLDDIVKRDNKRDVILNYHNLLFQRIILNISGTSSIFVNNSLNGNRIGQTFPNVDASLAFNFVFKAEENQIVSDLQSLQKKTTETSLLLGNLIDVLEEIRLSKLQLLNLTSAAFVLESQTCKLGLHLSFISYKSGKKIVFIIDMTDLNRSVYPSDPSELPIKVCEARTTLPQPSIDVIMASIRNLQPGRTVILRLCRMVSRLIHSLQ
ncbi:uncharacterized protein LOC8082273 isoform X2 [Sorghum bicolor]|uniref:uncharacterized protein LOC8082273 isoform X2 n=1 Tax=Sorghum bicolor TaxID=4558 RepID=UPI000B425934|nr:uncharacterized protein LOC8082273 isoform X2 [Sorghum bicolor]|eukprot:XP_021306058.1 uncharacterized protein LOC8082273 isoform X2 [Sorghum bicolor]